MNTTYKKKIILFLWLVFFAVGTMAQQNHFIYLQTENKRPFYVKMDKKVLSSSVSGYLIIPKLQDGNYALSIGFPKDEWPEQNVTCIINKKDVGYLVKNFGNKGWGLFNLQTMEVIKLGANTVQNKTTAEDTKQDIFSNILSDVVNDPSIIIKSEEEKALARQDTVALVKEEKPVIKEVPAIVKEEKPTAKEEVPSIVKEEVKPPVKEVAKTIITEDKATEKTTAKQEAKPLIEIIKKEESPVPVVTSQKINKLFSLSSSEGTDMVYVDIVNGVADTIRLFVPAEKNAAIVKQEKKITDPTVEIPKEEIKKDTIKTEPEKIAAVQPQEEKKEDIKKEAVTEAGKAEEVKEPVVIKAEEVKKEEVKKAPVKAVKENGKSKDSRFIDIELPNPNAAKKDTTLANPFLSTDENKAEPVKEKEKPAVAAAKPLIFNSDCKNLAAEDDFLKLRKKMAAEDKDDDMLAAAKKAFKAKCFTTEQVKNLSVLFLKDEGKYKFFDTAYPFVSDSYNFGSLESQLTDNYFITRFKAMIHH